MSLAGVGRRLAAGVFRTIPSLRSRWAMGAPVAARRAYAEEATQKGNSGKEAQDKKKTSELQVESEPRRARRRGVTPFIYPFFDIPRSFMRPFDREMRDLLGEDVFEDFFPRIRGARRDFDWVPRVDVSENEKELSVTAELPGVKKEDLKVRVEDGLLTISGERKSEKKEEGGEGGRRWVRTERQYGSFHRVIELPDNIDPKNIRAEFKEGVLYVNVGKTKDSHTVDVQVQ